MDDEGAAARLAQRADEIAHELVALGLVDANAVLDGDRHLHHVDHRLHAVGHQLRLVHQAGAESAALHALAWAAAVEVDLVVTPFLAELGAMRELGRLAAAELQRDRMFLGVEAKMPRHVAVHQRARGHHLGVEQGAARQQPVKVAAVAVGPIHHRSDGDDFLF